MLGLRHPCHFPFSSQLRDSLNKPTRFHDTYISVTRSRDRGPGLDPGLADEAEGAGLYRLSPTVKGMWETGTSRHRPKLLVSQVGSKGKSFFLSVRSTPFLPEP